MRKHSDQTTSFSARLTWLNSSGLVLLALTSAALSAMLLVGQARGWIEGYLRTSASQVASTSAFVLLSGDRVAASAALAQLSGIPGLLSATIVTQDNVVLARVGDGSSLAMVPLAQASVPPEKLFVDERNHWHLRSRVVPQAAATTPYDDVRPAPDPIGWVYLQWDGSLLTQVAWLVFAMSLVPAVVLAAIIGLLVRILAVRLTKPLSSLSAKMRGARDAGELTEANVEGAAEVREMALSFNALVATVREQVATIESHAVSLEQQVESRTAELEAALARTEAVTRTLTHDLRTPVHSIMGHIDLAREELIHLKEVGALDSCLTEAAKAGGNLLTKLEQLLDLARLQAGEATAQVAPVDFAGLVSRVEAAVSGIARQRGTKLTAAVEQKGQRTFKSDEQKLERILENLASNACRHTHDGQVHILVDVGEQSLTISVADTGVGIHSDRLAAIFEPFHTESNGGRTADAGIGLGLHIAKRYCELLGGTLSVASTPGEGTEFSVRIPFPTDCATHTDAHRS